MPRVRDEIIQKLWRGKDPFASSRSGDVVPDMQGWGSQHRYLTEAIETLRPSIVVEVGVWKGASTIRMASRLRDLAIDGVVIAIDTWLGSWDHWVQDQWFRDIGSLESSRGILATFLANVRSADLENYIVPLPLDSVNAAQVLRHFKIFPDVVHLDAAPDHASVLTGLRQWWPLLKPGGLMIGNDYRLGNDWPGVKRAFDDYFRPLGLLPLENADEKCRVTRPLSNPRDSDLSRTLKATGSAVSRWREERRIEQGDLDERDDLSVEERLDGYVRFSGPNWRDGQVRIMNRIVAQLKARGGEFTRDEIFGPHGEVAQEPVQGVVPGFRAHYLRPVGTDGFERFELLAGFDNPFSHLALPPRINVNMGKPAAPPLVVYRTEAVDLFLTPLGYQLFRTADGTYWPAVSTRAYPQEAMEFPHFTVNKTVVLVQDVFEGTNFSHFLFDWLPRLGHFLNSGLADPSQCVFVMGGAPSEFHFHALRAMCDMFSLDEAQFVFPLASEIWHIEGSLYYFSDLKAAIMHPAHMAHRRSMAIVRDVAARVQSPVGDLKRIYISRGDTPLRKIANEIELSRALRSLGFMEVQLGAIPYLEQLKLVRGAEVIVAPHGMGLTHIAFHDGRPLIIEIHNPNIGTDAYAFISHALGFTYRPVFGTALAGDGNHFTVDPRDVIAILAEEGISAPPEAARDGTSPGVRAVFFPGVQSISPSEMLGADPLGPAIAEYRHVRDDPAVQSDNNVGWLETSGLSVGAIYHCSCDVWLPSGFEGERLVLEGSSDKILGVSHADLSQREQWQTIRVHVVANRDVVAFVLRCDCGAADFFYSRKWTFDAGTAANGAG